MDLGGSMQEDPVRLKRIAYHWGDRGEESCKGLWEKVPPEYKSCRSFGDCRDTYQKVIDSGKHPCVGKQEGETNHIENPPMEDRAVEQYFKTNSRIRLRRIRKT